MEPEATSTPQTLPSANKRKEPAEEDSVETRISVLAQWAVVSEKVFDLEEKLDKAKKLRSLLEQENPWIGQVKGIVRSGQRKALAESPAQPTKAAGPPKKKQAREEKEEEKEKPPKKPISTRRSIENRMKDMEEKGKLPRWNPAFDRHTFDDAQRLTPNYLDESK